MKSKLKTGHEELIGDEDKSIFGVLINYWDNDSPEHDEMECLFYIYNDKRKTYVFFKTIYELSIYYYNGLKNMNRAYMKEDTFDRYYNFEIDGKFSNILEWTE